MPLVELGRYDHNEAHILVGRLESEDIAAIAFSTDALQKLFGAESVWLSGVRNFGLGALNHLPVLKNLLIQHAAA